MFNSLNDAIRCDAMRCSFTATEAPNHLHGYGYFCDGFLICSPACPGTLMPPLFSTASLRPPWPVPFWCKASASCPPFLSRSSSLICRPASASGHNACHRAYIKRLRVGWYTISGFQRGSSYVKYLPHEPRRQDTKAKPTTDTNADADYVAWLPAPNIKRRRSFDQRQQRSLVRWWWHAGERKMDGCAF